MLLAETSWSDAALQAEREKDAALQWDAIARLSVLSFVCVTLPTERLGSLAVSGAESESDAALKRTLVASRVVLGPFSAAMMDSAAAWLDQGIRKVLVDAESLADEELQRVATAVSELPASRVVLRLPVDAAALLGRDCVKQMQDKLRRLEAAIGGVVLSLRSASASQLTSDDEFAQVSAALQPLRDGLDEGFVLAVEWDALRREAFDRAALVPRVSSLHAQGIHLLAPALPRVTAAADRARFVDAAEAFVKCLRSDRPDGLFTTVVVDESGVALGLVYSSEASVLAAVESGRGVYYSRSRQGLWRKGESSGNFQELVQLDLDCDSDALRFMVRQSGAGFCHLNTRTCWGDAGGLPALQAMLESRLQAAPAGSYTKRLFDDAELLRNKLVEEAQELAEAQTPTHVAEEAADVMYFAMVRCVAAGATLTDVERQLDMRSLKVKRRPGNSKAYRIDAANEILKKQKQ
ncbi:hypothetical protein P43SY_001370 [Pythium insidiosum]|uniref:Phosphoribosyl-AMP cyclohydrolase domain-containing protein n=1 Tax=Pythium insidiosum TaxID=114742 RepID=A0AAD5QAZ5_PYTIN|nr:hypothetical protein P43SY_001370 [Pythium insidiosum]